MRVVCVVGPELALSIQANLLPVLPRVGHLGFQCGSSHHVVLAVVEEVRRFDRGAKASSTDEVQPDVPVDGRANQSFGYPNAVPILTREQRTGKKKIFFTAKARA